MVNIRKILYPTDFSKHSLVAFPFAIDLAQRYEAKLHCLHVLDTDNEFFLENGYIAPLIIQTPLPVEQLQKSAKEHMDVIVKEYISGAKNFVTQKVILGKPFIEIIHYCRDENIDLVVMGTHGHSALASMLLGSVAEKVVRKAPCPVLSVRHPEHRFKAP